MQVNSVSHNVQWQQKIQTLGFRHTHLTHCWTYFSVKLFEILVRKGFEVVHFIGKVRFGILIPELQRSEKILFLNICLWILNSYIRLWFNLWTLITDFSNSWTYKSRAYNFGQICMKWTYFLFGINNYVLLLQCGNFVSTFYSDS